MAYNGQLRQNEIFGAINNMIISQQVFADNIKGTYSSLVEKNKVDGTLYGDTKLYYDTDCLESVAWGNDAEATNLLELHRPDDPEVQAIYLDKFRQIRLTVDNYLSKRAFMSEGSFSNFNSVMLQWIRDTKKIYDSTIYNAYVGTVESEASKGNINVPTLGIDAEGEEKNKLEAEMIAQYLADLFVEMKDISRDFNDYGYLRSYSMDDIRVVWNSSFVNKIKKIDLPTIFHKDGLIDKFEDEVLPNRYFGEIIDELDTVFTGTVTEAQKGKIRAISESAYTVGEGSAAVRTHVFAGDALPVGATYTAGTVYINTDDIICKVIHKDAIPYMSAFEVGTSFFNPRSLTETHYLTFGHNTLQYLKGKPVITLRATAE